MKFGGLQKLTLLDYPQKVACTVFCTGCDFRCPFCHNNSIVTGVGEEWTVEEILTFLNKRKTVLEGVCLTGGEPLLYPDVADFLASVKQMGYKVKLDTNGSFPYKLEKLVKDGLVDYVAMDVKNTPELYAITCGADVDVNAVRQSAKLLLSGAVDYEFRTTVTRTFHTEQSLAELALLLKDCKRWFLQQFVHGEDLIDPSVEGYSDDELRSLYEKVRRYCPSAQLRGI